MSAPTKRIAPQITTFTPSYKELAMVLTGFPRESYSLTHQRETAQDDYSRKLGDTNHSSVSCTVKTLKLSKDKILVSWEILLSWEIQVLQQKDYKAKIK